MWADEWHRRRGWCEGYDPSRLLLPDMRRLWSLEYRP